MNLDAKLEAILFAAARPLAVKRLAEIAEAEPEAVKNALEELAERLKGRDGGLQLVRHGQEAELATRPEAAEAVRAALKEETEGELTRPSLEALAVLAYRGPMTRPELEQIRGVQSSLILRNLMLRGLVEMREDARLGQPLYAVTLDFLKHLGFARVEDLPEFDVLRQNRAVEQVLDELRESSAGHPGRTLAV